jgi:tRNA threonylcarbamoyladenosine biosynthesis protein TsaB
LNEFALTHILAIDTSSAWCSVALSLPGTTPELRHELVSSGASQLLLPWVEDLLLAANLQLKNLDAIAIGIGPGAFTGVRLGVAAVQGLAISANLPVIPVASLDAIAVQASKTMQFQKIAPKFFVIAIDARMDEIYWAKYQSPDSRFELPTRCGDIHLSKPEDIELEDIHYLGGSAIKAYGERLFTHHALSSEALDADISISALGILECAQKAFQNKQQCNVRELAPLYVRDKVALTTNEREIAFGKTSP